MRLRFLCFAALGLVAFATAAFAAQPSGGDTALRVLPQTPNQAKSAGLLRDYLRKESHILFERRIERFESLNSVEAIDTYRGKLQARFVESLGGWPERTPLNARVVGQLAGAGFRIEKVIYESQPGFFVPALLYLPDGPGPHPVVLMPCGHSQTGKGGYQQPATTLAQNGLAVFCFDPIGQGERSQALAPAKRGDRQPPVAQFPSTSEHLVTGVAPILLGRSLTSYMIWDGIRAIDYLETRADLDSMRLGCAGNSGGGMMTSYLMALEPRIVAAAPSCFMTTSARKNEHPGPGDAEQNIHAQYAYGMDHPDFLILHAPQPVLIGTATRDYVPIEGAWEAFRQAKRVYTRLGYAERVDLIETDATHGFSVQIREGVTRWMRRWLLQRDDVVWERPSKLFSDAELECTPDGQVLRLPGARSIFDLNRAEAAKLAAERSRRWATQAEAERRQIVRQTASIRAAADLPLPQVAVNASVERSGYRIRKVIITPAGGIPLPALHFVPATPARRACLYLHGRGKHADAGSGGAIEELVRDGAEVLAVDLRGFGETAMHPWRTTPADVAGDNGAEAFVAYMLGRPLAGMRAEDVLVSAKFLAEVGGTRRPLELVAVEDAAIAALHAAALEPGFFSRVRLVRAIDSWQRVIDATVTRRQLEGVVHGALRRYDLPDLTALAGAVEYVKPVDATGQPLAP